MPRKEWRDAHRILAVRLDNIGDVVMTGPALRAIKADLPNAEITLLASPVGARVAPLLPWVDHVLVHRALWQEVNNKLDFDPAREQAFIATLRRAEFDAAMIFTSFSQSPYPPAYACYLARVPLRAGQARDFGGDVLSDWVQPLSDDAHQVDRNLHLVRDLGFEAGDARLEIDIPWHIQKAADALLTGAGIETGDGFIALAPGASCAARRYDARRFADVARRLARRSGLPVVILGRDKEWESLPGGDDGIVSLAGQTTVAELAAVLARASLVVANNSGSMHLADALGRPMTILYSGTELESQWRPRRSVAHLLRRAVACSPCYLFNCPYHMECLDISTSEVVESALDLLAASARVVRSPGETAQGERPCVRSAF